MIISENDNYWCFIDSLDLKKVKWDPKNIDSKASEEGLAQVENISNIIESENITHVLISPLKRAMTTALESMKSHPNLSDAKFIIHPFLSSIFEAFVDIPNSSLESTKEQYEAKYGVKISIADEKVKDFRN